jgi:hypothetical protein
MKPLPRLHFHHEGTKDDLASTVTLETSKPARHATS